jgi:hypothetical protein
MWLVADRYISATLRLVDLSPRTSSGSGTKWFLLWWRQLVSMCLTPHSMSFCIALISDFVEVFRFGIFLLHCPGRLAHSVIQMKSITMDHADLALSVCYVRNSTCALTFCTSGDIFWNDNCCIKNTTVISFRSLRIRVNYILTLCHFY